MNVRIVTVPFLIPNWAAAQTWGGTILVNQRYMNTLTPMLFAHEYVHVLQWRRYTWRFPFMYVWELIRNGYENNKFERDAHDHAPMFIDEGEQLYRQYIL